MCCLYTDRALIKAFVSAWIKRNRLDRDIHPVEFVSAQSYQAFNAGRQMLSAACPEDVWASDCHLMKHAIGASDFLACGENS